MLGPSRIVASILASVLMVTPALAQPSKKEASAQELVKKAIKASQAGDHLGAIDLYLEAYKLASVPVLLSNIGREYQQADKPIEALRYFCKYLDAEPTGTSAGYATAQAKVIQIQIGNRDVDDSTVCKAKGTKDKGERDGKGERETKDHGDKGDRDGTKVKIGTTEGGDEDEDHPRPTKGGTRVARPDDGGLGDEPKHDQPDDPGAMYKDVGLGGMITGAALAGIGFYYGYRAQQISDKITNHNPMDPWPDTIKSDEHEGQQAQNRQIGFLIAGAVVAGGGVAVFFYGRSKTSERTVSLHPVVTPNQAGFALDGRF